jgi:hypothetical protein
LCFPDPKPRRKVEPVLAADCGYRPQSVCSRAYCGRL